MDLFEKSIEELERLFGSRSQAIALVEELAEALKPFASAQDDDSPEQYQPFPCFSMAACIMAKRAYSKAQEFLHEEQRHAN